MGSRGEYSPHSQQLPAFRRALLVVGLDSLLLTLPWYHLWPLGERIGEPDTASLAFDSPQAEHLSPIPGVDDGESDRASDA